MNKNTYYIITIILLFTACAGEPFEKSEAKIKQCFEKYQQTILAQNGVEALKCINQNTIDYYDGLVVAARSGTKQSIQQRPFIDQFNILAARHDIKIEQLKKMSGTDLLVHSIDNGMTGKDAVSNLEFNSLDQIKGRHAVANIVIKGTDTNLPYDFSRDNNVWKIDLTSVFEMANEAILEIIEDTGKTKDEYLLLMVEGISARPVTEAIWNPLL